jgi:ABC-2 type transport system ATP-binding protein
MGESKDNMAKAKQNNLVEVEQLTRFYDANCAVNNVSFTLAKGEVLGFLGPNGAGKSTTMQMLCGALAPSSGRIVINGIDLLENPLEAKRHIGFLPEQPPLYPELTVNEYLNYCAQLRRVRKTKIKSAVDIAKQRCGLQDAGRRLIGNLSKGFQQRVGIAQALLHSPQLVVLDEPTVGLDPIQIREIRALIKEIGKDHGVILSTHILPEVQMTCNRVQIIHQGRLVFSDTLEHLSDRMRVSSLLAAFQKQPPLKTLEKIEGVAAIESLASGRMRIHFAAGNDPTDRLVRASVEQNWQLKELTPETRSLEQIFMELISSDHTPAGAAA